MRALHSTSPRRIEEAPLVLADVPLPHVEADAILIRTKTCGICHTDLHVIEGDLPAKKLPIVPGHQVIGVVERLGSHVSQPKVGDRIGVPWLHGTCGRCEYCTSARENLCDNARFTGYDVDGGYAEYMTAPAAFAYKIPEGFSDEVAAPLLCAGIIGFRALRLSGVKRGEVLALFGFGASAHLTLQVAVHQGCEVFVFSRSEHHRSLARKLGASWTGSAEDRPPALVHGAISFAPAGELVPKALRIVRKGGTLALAGIHLSPIPRFEYSLLYHERVLRSVANSTRQDAVDFLRIAAEIPLRPEVEVFPLEQANEALLLLKQGKIQGAGVLKLS